MSQTRFIIFLLIIIALFVGVFFIFQNKEELRIEPKVTEKREDKKEEQSEKLENLIDDNVLLKVPFISQAPLANWENPIFQDGCEEASILMAMRWIEGREISKQEAQKEIIAISEFEQSTYGEYRDRSTKDTAQLIKDYFNYQTVRISSNITIEDIISELKKGNLVITPMNGQLLANPFYTSPGPERHMLAIKGYDSQTKEFITNDVGTRHGESYRYPENVLYQAIRDYETGYHEPILSINKTMIVVEWPYKACYADNCFNVELADTPQETSKGLMFRQELEENWGMLFVFEKENKYPFWMKNTLIPLDIIWIDDNFKVVYIKENAQPCQSENCPNIVPSKKAKYVLEINAGLADNIGIEAGDRVDFKF